MDRVSIYFNQRTAVTRSFVEEGTTSATPPTEVLLRARRRDSTTTVLEVAAAIGARTAEAVVEPGALPAGIYRAWLHLTLEDSTTRDTAEFELTCLEHAPGVGIRTGRVYRMARLKVPVVWDALRNYQDFGDVGLMTLISVVEQRTMGRVLTIAEEESANLLVANYLAHAAAIEAIPAAIDYWTNQIVSQTARGSDEVHTYPDRISANEEQLKRMIAQLDALRAEAEGVLGVSIGAAVPAMELVGGGDPIMPALEDLRPIVTGSVDPYWFSEAR